MRTIISAKSLCVLICCFAAFLLTGCKKKYDVARENMAFDKVIYQKTPPKECILDSNKSKIVASSAAANEFVIVDSLMFVATNRDNGMVEALSLDDFSSKGSFINKGNASGELTWNIDLVLNTTFTKKDGSLYATVYDITGKVYSVNISDWLNGGKADMVEICSGVDIPRPAFWVKQLADSTVIARVMADEQTAQKRILIKDGKTSGIKNMGFADGFTVPPKTDYNLLSTLVGVSPDGTKCVEAMIGFNYINVYSPFSGEGFTICCGNKLDKLSDALATPRPERKYMFADVRTYDFGFAVLKFDTDDITYQKGGDFSPSILLFKWDGEALGELKPNVHFSCFDIDVRTGKLYLLDDDSKLRQFDLPAEL